MTVPLWVLAFFAAVAGVLVISNVHFSLSNWMDPVFGANLYNNHLTSGDLWALGTVDAVIAVVGVFIGLRIWVRRADHPALEPAFLRGAWFINELYDAVFGRPSERLAAFCADVVDPKVIDGAVNGVAGAVRRTGTLVRRTQTGYVRNYVLGIVFGAVVVLAFMLTAAVVGLMTSAGVPLPDHPRAGAGHRRGGGGAGPRQGGRRWFHEAVGVAVTARRVADRRGGAVEFKTGDGGYQMVTDHDWASSSASTGPLGVDGISLFLVLLTAVLFPLAHARGPVPVATPRSFVAWLLLLEAACLGSFVSLDLIFFFLFFELTLVPAYFIIGGWGYARRGYAAIKFFVYTFAGSAFLLVGILSIAFIHQSQTGVLTFELPALMHTHLSGTEGVLLLPRLHRRLRGQGADLPVPHLVARRLRRGPDRRRHPAGRRDGQARHLRDHPLRPQPVPPGHEDPGPVAADPGRDRDHLRRAGGLRPARPEAPAGLLVAGPDRLHRPRHLRPQQPGR